VVVVDTAAPVAGEHVVDVGCGTGNAALLAAARGARVTGVDPATRLLGVARDLADAGGLEAQFVEGEAAAIPLADGAADAVLSVFGAIFAPDPAAAAAEMRRVRAPGGRIVLSAWIPEGAISDAVRVVRGGQTGPPPFPWHDADALAGLFGAVELTEHRLAFTGPSPRDFVDAEFANHPLWSANDAPDKRDDVVAVLEAANEDRAAFRVTSRYVVATARG
jgi:SAM-dependent methyltransferase